VRSRLALFLLVAGAVAVAAAPAPAAKRAPRKTVQIHDNYYEPSKLTVKAGTIIRWHWSEDSADVHDVKLRKAPRGVRKFQSDPLAAGESFSRKLTKPGTYSIICTFHEEEMTMTIRVRRP
jgi:plastocyanin